MRKETIQNRIIEVHLPREINGSTVIRDVAICEVRVVEM
jgi:hypothetical protein